jgi:DNA-binding CsgD family transcriptional regulator
LLVLVQRKFESEAASSLRAGIAVLDGDGVIRWTNHASSRAKEGTNAALFASAGVGSDLLTLASADGRPLSDAIHGAIAAVIAGATSYVEIQAEPAAGGPAMVAITPTRGGRGAVVLYAESSAIRAAGAPLAIDGTRIAEDLTPRELEVLTRMMAGLSNRAIASDLGIEYTTVRGHVQSVLAKLGARSRVDAVAIAYRSGLAREAGLVLDRKSRRSPGDKAAGDVGRIREAKVV